MVHSGVICIIRSRRRQTLKAWKVLNTERVYHSEYLSLFNDKIMLPHGRQITYTRVELKDFVSILPLFNSTIVMIKIFRYPTNRLSLEIPSGHVETGETPEASALRELEEETGYRAGSLRDMGWFHPWTRSTQRAYLFLAKDLTKHEQRPEKTEQITVELLSADTVKRKLKTGKITHAPSIIAVQKFLQMQDQHL